jgi:ribosomal protein S12 methylthiotransferase accessory factor
MKIRPNIQSMLVDLEEDYPFVKLAQPFAGVTGMPRISPSPEINQPQLDVSTSLVSDISALVPELRSWDGRAYGESGMMGACADEEASVAAMKSIAEAAERYAMTLIRNDEYRVASADELGDEALDWRLFPRCTDEEYRTFTGLVPFDPKRKIRWVKGVSLIDGRVLYVPVSLSHIATATRRAESFTLPISTGVAVHSDIHEATARGLLEVVERDSIALTWYLRRPLPRIEVDPEKTGSFANRFRSFEASHVEQHLFDATTDLGIPVVYALMLAPGHPTAATVVTAASDLNPLGACAKAMREAVSTRLAVIAATECPDTPEECFKLEHGAAFMGRHDRQSEFDFLLNSGASVSLSDLPNWDTGDSRKNLQWLVGQLRAKKTEAVAVDLTTNELSSHGLRAVRVVIPQLMPMSYTTTARFLDHPRLHEYAKIIGKEGFTSDMVNSFPQPFA